jgi:hypothetical protein
MTARDRQQFLHTPDKNVNKNVLDPADVTRAQHRAT